MSRKGTGGVVCNDHQWEEVESERNSYKFTEVLCVYCGTLGEMDNATGDVFYPIT